MALTKINNNTLSAVTTLPAAIATGKVLQVVQGSNTTSMESTSTSFADGGLSASITPSATSSKVLVMVNQSAKLKRDSGEYAGGAIKILRGSTTLIGGPNGYEFFLQVANGTLIDNHLRVPLEILDSPSSTSSLTYKIQVRSFESSSRVFLQPNSIESIITLMEIAG